jgi:prepilin-type N-terminal cleavage/methylation domain-containing protein
MTKKLGFTLAEVLITLGIIGVVAAMTIPTLMNQTSQAEFKTGFKKVISTLNQAITMNVALEDTDFHQLASGSGAGSIYEMFNNRMNVIRTTDGADTTLDPGSPSLTMAQTGNYTIFFNDGMALSWPTASGSCVAGTGTCDAVVDVNGGKKPNRLTNCNAASTTAATDTGTCSASAVLVGDRYSVRFAGQGVYPNGPGARYVMYN